MLALAFCNVARTSHCIPLAVERAPVLFGPTQFCPHVHFHPRPGIPGSWRKVVGRVT